MNTVTWISELVSPDILYATESRAGNDRRAGPYELREQAVEEQKVRP